MVGRARDAPAVSPADPGGVGVRRPEARRPDLVRAGTALLPFALVCLQLQIPTVALGPVIRTIQADVGLDSAAAGALTSIPVFCFALLTPFAARIVGWAGVNRSLVGASLLIGTGVLARSTGSVAALFAGSVLLGGAIAVANIAIPTLVTRRYRHRALLMNGVQTSATNVGSALAAAVSAPVVALLGWQVGLAVWSATSFLAALVWWWANRDAMARRRPLAPADLVGVPEVGATGEVAAGVVVAGPHAPDGEPTSGGSLAVAHQASGGGGRLAARPVPRAVSGLRVPIAWVLGFTFAMHGLCYFAVSSWLPTLLQERSGLTAGAAGACVSVFMALGIVGPLALPLLLRLPGTRLWMLMTLTTLGWLACVLLLAFAPTAWLAAVLVGGMAQGACFTVIVTFGVHVAADETQSRGIQAVLQTVGFASAAVGPVLIGAVRDASGGWSAPLAIMVGVGCALVALGGVSSRLLVAHDAGAGDIASSSEPARR